MKLLYCRECGDIFSLRTEEKRCRCKAKTRGAYEADCLHAWYAGDSAVPLGALNGSFHDAVRNQPLGGLGEHFEAFVIPQVCPTFTFKEKKKK